MRRRVVLGLAVTSFLEMQGLFAAQRRPSRRRSSKSKPKPAERPDSKEARPGKGVERLTPESFFIPADAVEKNGEGMRGPSDSPPAGYEQIPILVDRPFHLTATEGGQFSLQYVIPLPLDVGEVSRDGSIVVLSGEGWKTDKLVVEVVTSQPHQNRSMYLHFTGQAVARSLTLNPQVLSFMTVPQKTLPRPTDRFHYFEAIRSRIEASTIYDASNNSLEPANRGDCGVHAVNVCVAAEGAADVIIGWDAGMLQTGSGCHAWAQSIEGNIVCDAAGHYGGPQMPTQIPATRGIEFVFAKNSPPAKLAARLKSGFNGGLSWITGAQIYAEEGATFAALSVPGAGRRSDDLLNLQMNVAKEWEKAIAKARSHSEEFIRERIAINRAAASAE
jgi:hypothetical protein